MVGQCYATRASSDYYNPYSANYDKLVESIMWGGHVRFPHLRQGRSLGSTGEGFWYQNGIASKLHAVDSCKNAPEGKGVCEISKVDGNGGFWLKNRQFARGDIYGAYEPFNSPTFVNYLVADNGELVSHTCCEYEDYEEDGIWKFTPKPDRTVTVTTSGTETPIEGPGGRPVRNWEFSTSKRPYFHPYDVNESGATVGRVSYIYKGSPVNRPYIFKNGKVTILPQPFLKHSKAYAINNHGVVGGYVADIAWRAMPAIWKGKKLTQLKVPYTDYKSFKSTRPIAAVVAVNDRNEYVVVGGEFSKNPRRTGGFFVYRGKSICVPYESLLKKMGRKDKIFPAWMNNKGQILMIAHMKNRVRTFLLTPKG